jgi:hypothetical protein
MRKIILTTLTTLAIGLPGLPAFAGDALSPDEMQGFMQKAQQERAMEAARVHPGLHSGRAVITDEEPSVTGSIVRCYSGPPECTAAGYVNMHYLREQHGGF